MRNFLSTVALGSVLTFYLFNFDCDHAEFIFSIFTQGMSLNTLYQIWLDSVNYSAVTVVLQPTVFEPLVVSVGFNPSIQHEPNFMLYFRELLSHLDKKDLAIHILLNNFNIDLDLIFSSLSTFSSIFYLSISALTRTIFISQKENDTEVKQLIDGDKFRNKFIRFYLAEFYTNTRAFCTETFLELVGLSFVYDLKLERYQLSPKIL